MQRPPSMVSARVPPCALAPKKSSVHQCSPHKAHLRDEAAQQRCPQDNSRPHRERADGLATAEDEVQNNPSEEPEEIAQADNAPQRWYGEKRQHRPKDPAMVIGMHHLSEEQGSPLDTQSHSLGIRSQTLCRLRS